MGEFHLKGDEPSVAAKSLEELLKSDPKDKTTLAQLVLAYAKFDLGKAMEMSKRLPILPARSLMWIALKLQQLLVNMERKLLDYLHLKPKALNNKKKLQSYLRLRKRRRGRRSC